MAFRLIGSRAKVARANEQLDSLRSELFAAMEPDGSAFGVDLQHDTYDGHPALTVVVSTLPTFSPRISIMIGEVVHDLRSALDQLAWGIIPIVQLKMMNPRAKEAIYFPMARSRSNFRNIVNRQLSGHSSRGISHTVARPRVGRCEP